MVQTIDSLDCALPSFSHSAPFNFQNGAIGFTKNYIWWSSPDKSEICAAPTSAVAHRSCDNDFSAEAEKCVIDSVLRYELPSPPRSVIYNKEEDSILVGIAEEAYRWISVSGSPSGLSMVTEVQLKEDVVCASFAGGDGIVLLTNTGKGYLITEDGSRQEILHSIDILFNSTAVLVVIAEHIVIGQGKQLFVCAVKAGSRLHVTQVKGQLPSELVEYADYSICGISPITGTEAAIMGTSDEGQNCIISIVDFFFESNEMQYKFVSYNDVFLDSASSIDSIGHLQWVPEVSLLLAGHSHADSAIVLQKKSKSKSSDSWKCLNLPEGKQLLCSLIGGDVTSSKLEQLGVCLLDEPMEMKRSADQVSKIEIVVFIVQTGGWISCHYGDLPDDMPVERKAVVQRESVEVRENKVEVGVVPTKPEVKQPGLLDASIKPPLMAEAKQPGLFDASVWPLEAKQPGLFDSSVKPPSAAAQPGLFDASIKPPPPAKQPGLFDPSVKPLPSTPPPGVFDSSVKTPSAAAHPDLFDASIKPPAAVLPGLFDASVKPIPAAAQPGLFDASVKPMPAAAQPGLFDASVKPTPAAAQPGLFDASVKPMPAAAQPGLFDISVKPMPAAAHPGRFDAAVEFTPANS